MNTPRRIAGFNVVDLVAGLLVVIGGIALMAGATTYRVGELARMGPGYMPLATGAVLVLIGAGLIFAGRASEATFPAVKLRPILAVFAGLLWLALTLESLGLVPSTIGMVVIVSLAQPRPSPIMITATAAFLVLFSIAVFVYALAIPITLFRL